MNEVVAGGRGIDCFPGILTAIAVRVRCRAEARLYLVHFDFHLLV